MRKQEIFLFTTAVVVCLMIGAGNSVLAKEMLVLKVHTVQQGDTLCNIASEYLGSADKWREVYGYNGYIKNPHWIFPGEELIIPTYEEIIEEPVAKVETVEQTAETAKEKQVPKVGVDRIIASTPDFDGYVVKTEGVFSKAALYDTVLTDIHAEGKVRPGTYLRGYVRNRTIRHPITGTSSRAPEYAEAAILKVIEVHEHTSYAKIIDCFEPLSAGSGLFIVNQ
jgi:hypothetical protein